MPSESKEGKCIHSFPPWEVPRKRKLRGMLKGRDCYDPIEEKLFTLNGGEITTSNRFSPIDDNEYNMKEVLQVKRMPDSHPEQNKRTPRKVYFRDQEDYILKMKNDSFCSSKCLNIEYNA